MANSSALAHSDARLRQASQRSSRLNVSAIPERFARPRILLLLAVFALTAFGALMIYSSSSITGLLSDEFGNDPSHYLVRQLIFIGMGSVAALVLALADYHFWTNKFAYVFLIASVVLLVLVIFSPSGADAYGATRWLQLGPFTLQPSELAKIALVLVMANICQRYFEDCDYSLETFLGFAALYLVVPLGLILFQPDKGTTLICVATLAVMLYLSGFSGKTLISLGAIFIGGFLLISMIDGYSRARILTVINPWNDYYGDGYQLIQGFYAFGSGGLFGVGIGSSAQKYFYLPMSYNDFIYAIIGEECGLVGTLGVLAAFAVILWAGFRIARYAPDLTGRLIAAGSTSMLIIQLLVNILGVLGVIPLSGKPVPFLSYGGSSVISCLMLVGLIMSVSRASHLDETESDRRRRDMSLSYHSSRDAIQDGYVGEPQPRSYRSKQQEQADARDSHPNLQLISGGATGATPLVSSERLSQTKGRRSVDSSGRVRIDLGPDPAERLRSRRDNATSSRGKDTRRGR